MTQSFQYKDEGQPTWLAF